MPYDDKTAEDKKAKKTEIDYEKANVLLDVQSKAAANGITLAALGGEALAELTAMNEAAQANAACRAEEAKAKAEEEAKTKAAKAKADADAEAAKAPKAVPATTYTSDTPAPAPYERPV